MRILMLSIFLIIISCKHSNFKENRKHHNIPNADKSESGEVIIKDEFTPPPSKEDPNKDQQGTDTIEVVTEEEKKKEEVPAAYLKINLDQMKHDSLYKNCVYISINGETIEKVVCNKDFDNPNLEYTYGPYDPNSCLNIDIEIHTFEPVYQSKCIKKIQANRSKHECEYYSTPLRVTRLANPERIAMSEKDSSHYSVAFEDSHDRDFNDIIFDIDFSEIQKHQVAKYNTCSNN